MSSDRTDPPIVDSAVSASAPLLPAARDASPGSDTNNASGLHALSLVFEFAHRIRTNLIPAIFASFSAATGGIVGLYIGLGIFGIAIALAIVRYLTFRYRLTNDHLLIDQGLVFRTHRSVPIDRIQNIDSVQNLFHRLFKVAEVRIETASGNEPEAIMRVISLDEVERLRSQVARFSTTRANLLTGYEAATALDAAQASSTAVVPTRDTSTDAAAIPSERVLTIPTLRLIQAGLISNRGQVLAGLVLGYFWQASVRGSELEKMADDQTSIRASLRRLIREIGIAGDWYSWFGSQLATAAVVVAAVLLIILIFRAFSALWFVLKFYDYQLTRRGRDFQIQCGLFTKVSATVPADRIQIICVHRTWLARWLGLASIRIEASGGSSKEEEDASATVARRWFVPVMSAEELPRVLEALQPGLGSDTLSANWRPLAPRAFARMIRLPLAVCGLTLLVGLGIGGLINWSSAVIPLVIGVVGIALTLLLARKRARSRKFAHTARGFIYRSGTLTQKTSYGFWDRTQSVSLLQSPFDRRWQMATVLLDTAGVGTADHTLSIEYLSSDAATEEFEHASSRLAR